MHPRDVDNSWSTQMKEKIGSKSRSKPKVSLSTHRRISTKRNIAVGKKLRYAPFTSNIIKYAGR